MTTRKAREFWICEDDNELLTASRYPCKCSERHFLVQEVLPEPTNAELYEMSQQANACELHFRQGFQAALKWMKGESE